jgi:3D (Asp-Asp-Asp) domain-containing protein
MTRQNFWRVLITVTTLTIMIAGWNSLAQSAPGQIEDLDGTLLSNNLALPAPLQVPLPLRFEALNVLGGNLPSAITSSTRLPSSLPATPSGAVTTRTVPASTAQNSTAQNSTAQSTAATSTSSSLGIIKAPSASSNPKPASVTKPLAKSVVKPTPKPVVKQKTTVAKVKPRVSTLSRRAGPSYFLKSTAYNSSVSQTDSSPRVTATGARTRFGVIALSRDMLRSIPYGSQVSLEDMGALGSGAGRGRFNSMLQGIVFIVEDTMNKRISRTVDVWFHSRSTALRWGKRQVKLTILRYGRR